MQKIMGSINWAYVIQAIAPFAFYAIWEGPATAYLQFEPQTKQKMLKKKIVSSSTPLLLWKALQWVMSLCFSNSLATTSIG